jgi:hypothetical protein
MIHAAWDMGEIILVMSQLVNCTVRMEQLVLNAAVMQHRLQRQSQRLFQLRHQYLLRVLHRVRSMLRLAKAVMPALAIPVMSSAAIPV